MPTYSRTNSTEMAGMRLGPNALGLLLSASLLLLTACGDNETAPGPGGVSVGEARALDEAAQMLDQQRLSDAVLTGEDQAVEAQ